jgi:polar amino acid transport system substrate-binding protein
MRSTSLNPMKGLFLFFSILLLLFACSPAEETTLEKVKRTGVIRVGYANDIPFGYVTEDGLLTGEAPEVARKVFSKMGVQRIEGIFVEFGSLIDGLKAGRYDMITAGMFVLPDRCKQISFSEPTYRVGQSFAVKAGNPKQLHSYQDVAQHSNAILCVMEGAVEGKYARANGIPETRIITVPNTAAGLDTVISGRTDALALTSLSIQSLIANSDSSEVERAQPFTNPSINGKEISGYGAFGFRIEDKALLDEFNRHLKSFVGSKEHMETVQGFGFTEFPEGVTTSELCKE